MSNLIFTLVHGTFSANADWIQQSRISDPNGFRAQLAKRFQKDIEFNVPPPWGSDSLLPLKDLTNEARLNGAQQLQKTIKDHPYLNQEQEKNKGDKKDQTGHFIVAHSHGGNVAMYALQEESVAKKVDGLICLATPFLYPRTRPLSVPALALSVIIMSIGLMQYLGTSDLLKGDWLMSVSAILMVALAIVVPACLTCLVAYERFLHKHKGDQRLTSLLKQLSYQNPNIPILLIRSSGDEASGLLRGVQFMNWLGGIGMRLGGGQLYLLVCAIAVYLAWVTTYKHAEQLPSFILPLLKQGLIASSVIMVILLMALTVSRILVGFDAWRWVGEIETMVEDGPPGIPADLIVSQPRTSDLKLSHTQIYNQPETIDAIHRWCSNALDKKKDDLLNP